MGAKIGSGRCSGSERGDPRELVVVDDEDRCDGGDCGVSSAGGQVVVDDLSKCTIEGNFIVSFCMQKSISLLRSLASSARRLSSWTLLTSMSWSRSGFAPYCFRISSSEAMPRVSW